MLAPSQCYPMIWARNLWPDTLAAPINWTGGSNGYQITVASIVLPAFFRFKTPLASPGAFFRTSRRIPAKKRDLVVHGIRKFWQGPPPPAYPMNISISVVHGIRSLFRYGLYRFRFILLIPHSAVINFRPSIPDSAHHPFLPPTTLFLPANRIGPHDGDVAPGAAPPPFVALAPHSPMFISPREIQTSVCLHPSLTSTPRTHHPSPSRQLQWHPNPLLQHPNPPLRHPNPLPRHPDPLPPRSHNASEAPIPTARVLYPSPHRCPACRIEYYA
jgi:hypothetical protein